MAESFNLSNKQRKRQRDMLNTMVHQSNRSNSGDSEGNDEIIEVVFQNGEGSIWLRKCVATYTHGNCFNYDEEMIESPDYWHRVTVSTQRFFIIKFSYLVHLFL